MGRKPIDVQVYSDACEFRSTRTGSHVVVGEGISTKFVTERYPDAATNTEAELMAALAGLRRAPEGAKIVLFTDMPWVIEHAATKHVVGFVGKKLRLVELLAEVWRRGAQLVRVDRRNRLYRRCDALAYSLAKGSFRSSLKSPKKRRHLPEIAPAFSTAWDTDAPPPEMTVAEKLMAATREHDQRIADAWIARNT